MCDRGGGRGRCAAEGECEILLGMAVHGTHSDCAECATLRGTHLSVDIICQSLKVL